MLFHQIGLGFMFIHVVYLSALPILLDEKRETPPPYSLTTKTRQPAVVAQSRQSPGK